jgi:hypothetical protein
MTDDTIDEDGDDFIAPIAVTAGGPPAHPPSQRIPRSTSGLSMGAQSGHSLPFVQAMPETPLPTQLDENP